MGRGHQWFKLSNMGKTKKTSSVDESHLGESKPSASPSPPETPTPPPETTTNPNGEAPVGDEEKEEEEEKTNYLGPKALYMLMVALLFVIIILTLDQSILATAIPYITDEFHTISDIGWYASAYLLSTAALQVSELVRVNRSTYTNGNTHSH